MVPAALNLVVKTGGRASSRPSNLPRSALTHQLEEFYLLDCVRNVVLLDNILGRRGETCDLFLTRSELRLDGLRSPTLHLDHNLAARVHFVCDLIGRRLGILICRLSATFGIVRYCWLTYRAAALRRTIRTSSLYRQSSASYPPKLLIVGGLL